eukprot:TRINITY_DN2723_c2_g1_i1.p1 TRINITY_DN2723_c2_g1~~TRINITY_DN2723_c2_g1_i1.p1  ORF type:complete len:836 (+),score=307.10 TRINITY_DN2723_c2_g1_i1:71-2509(+)
MQPPARRLLCALVLALSAALLLAAASSAPTALPKFSKAAATCAAEGEHNVKITATSIPAPVRDVYWITDDLVYVVLTTGVPLKSLDQGKTWVDVTPLMEHFGDNNEDNVLNNSVYQIHGTTDPDVIYFEGWDTNHWVSTDGGASYRNFRSEGAFLQYLNIHPLHPNFLFGTALVVECLDYQTLQSCHQELWVSEDYGETFSSVASYVWYAQWGNVASQEKQIFWYEDGVKTGYQFTYENREARLFRRQFIRSSDFGETVDVVFQHSAGFEYENGKLFVAKIDVEDRNLRHLYVSHDDGDSLEEEHFPGSLTEQHYYIVQDTGDVSFINIETETPAWGELVVSDLADLDYTISLNRNKRFVDGSPDLFRIPGLDGAFLSNSYDAAVLHDPSHREAYIETLISLDSGGEWERLVTDEGSMCAQNKTLEDCAQHLFINIYGVPILAHENAIGLVVAPGNRGQFLKPTWQSMHMFLSRDGGLSWQPFHEGSGHVEFGDHGGVMMFGNELYDDHVDITLSQGESWTACTVLKDSNYMWRTDGIDSPPNAKDIDFFVYGLARNENNHDDTSYAILHLDLSRYGIRDCVGEESAGSFDSDYEYFEPVGMNDQGCFLGEKVQYLRRKQHAECYNGFEFEDRSVLTQCPCTVEDYECDGECFYSDPLSTVCTNTCVGTSKDPQMPPDECPVGTTWSRSRGYRLVPGSKCSPEAGIDLLPEHVECEAPPPPPPPAPANVDDPYSFHTSVMDPGSFYFYFTATADADTSSVGDFLSLIALLAAVVLFLLLLMGIGFVVWRNSPTIRLMIRRRLGTASPDDYYA